MENKSKSFNARKVIFDIIPAKSVGSFEFGREINLGEHHDNEVLPVSNLIKPIGPLDSQFGFERVNGGKENDKENKAGSKKITNFFENLVSDIVAGDLREDIKEELTGFLDRKFDPRVELIKVGGKMIEGIKTAKPRHKPILRKVKSQLSSRAQVEEKVKGKISEEDFYKNIISKIREPIRANKVLMVSSVKPLPAQEIFTPNLSLAHSGSGGRDVEAGVASFYEKTNLRIGNLRSNSDTVTWGEPRKVSSRGKLLNFLPSPAKKRKFFKLWIFAVFGIGIAFYGLTLKNELLKDGTSAFQNLQQAQESLKNFNFKEAADSFRKSYEDFAQASQNLNLIGAGLISSLEIIDPLTAGNAGKLKSARDIVEAGKFLADAGKAMSQALDSLSKTGTILNPADTDKTKPVEVIRQLKDALLFSDKSFSKAKMLLASMDETIVPEDQKDSYFDFKSKIPIFEESIADAINYADFFEAVIGIDRPKKYLLLFQNYSELRPSGGFPGTYGVISFASGGLSDFFVDDVYNLDGQLKQNIIPPKQLQHITPTWGMRDAGWFADFPSSARKTMWFFNQEAGYRIDGVIALNPDIVARILEIIGPIEMPDYEMALDQNNFLASVQEEVEYGENRVQPKRVVIDFAPRFLEKLYLASSEQWIKIFQVFAAGLEEKDVIIYLDDESLEEFVVGKGFGGEIKSTSSDYLMVTFSNIKGSKTDVMIDSSISVDTNFKNDQIARKISLSRKHNGGDSEYGFYNRQNPAYVRVLLPEKAESVKISGNDFPNFRPLIGYDNSFVKDKDLSLFESSFSFDKNTGVDRFEESGKKGAGFWMVTDPGETKTVELEYALPFDSADNEPYNFYFQKQPGLDWKNFKFIIKKSGDAEIESSPLTFSRIGDTLMADDILKKDFYVEIKTKY